MISRLLLLLCLFALGARATESGPVYIIPVRSEISEAQSVFLRRAVKEAERQHASALVLDMDTYGGEVKAAIDEMDTLLRTSVPTFTYIDTKAISAGALITLATKHVFIAPGGVIGAAAPVSGEGKDLEKTMADKVASAVSATARGAAQKSGHNPELADCFIRKEAVLKYGDVTLDGPDTLLSLDAAEATRKFDGKPVLAEGTAETLEEMLKLAGLTAAIHRVEPTGFERLSVWLTRLAPILLMCGIVGAYVEFKTPGFGLPGITSVICFALFFGSSYMAGLSGWEAAALFILGVLLVLSELLLHPGTILPGVAGVLLMVAALLWAMVDRFPGDPLVPGQASLHRPLLNLSLALVGAGIAMVILARYLPKTRFFRRIILETTNPPGVLRSVAEIPVAAGASGTTRTTLRPSGKAEFGGTVVDVVSQGEFIAAGQPVQVLEVRGPRVVVTSV